MRPLRTTLLSLAVSLLAATPSGAALRSPQVPVSGTALANFFASRSQTIAVVGDQQDMQVVSLPTSESMEFHEILPVSGQLNLGLYNVHTATPPLYQIYPGSATDGWYCVCSFRDSPDRLVVNLFDYNDYIQGTVTYLGADRTGFAFYTQGPGGMIHSDDARNAGGEAKVLMYNGTGAHAGSIWFAFELSPGPGGDFADLVFLATFSSQPTDARQTTWGRVRQLYR